MQQRAAPYDSINNRNYPLPCYEKCNHTHLTIAHSCRIILSFLTPPLVYGSVRIACQPLFPFLKFLLYASLDILCSVHLALYSLLCTLCFVLFALPVFFY